MKSSGMPTANNNTPLESYCDYREGKINSMIEKINDAVMLVKNSSLKECDKRLALLQAKFDIEKELILNK